MKGASQERARAARTLVDIIHEGRTTDQSFGRRAGHGARSSPEASPLISELVYGSLRYYLLLEPAVTRHLSRPFRTKDYDLKLLLIVGAYQLIFMRIPDHAAINETVNACRALKKPWARALINAVLRKVAADKTPIIASEHSFGLPAWLLQRLQQDLPDHADALAEASLERAPMSLRVNLLRADSADCRQALDQDGIVAHPGWLPEHLILEQPVPTRQLPGHAEGYLSVQDGGALFAAELIIASLAGADRSSPAILDACAAPGGKLFHLAERLPEASLTGVEISAERLAHMRDEASRLGHDDIRLLKGDATGNDWLPAADTVFDVILLDAPCSGSGTLRRHPDIKLLRQPEDLTAYARQQSRLLDNLWQRLTPGGTLLYCTCSLFAEENDQVIAAFLAEHADASIEPLTLPLGMATRHGWQLLPLPAGDSVPNRTVDGFYFARMTRREKAS